MAVGLAKAGCDVVGVNVVEPKESVDLMAETGRKFFDLRADLSNKEALPGIVADAVAATGQVDILVNNAGIIRREEALDFSEDDWDAVMNLNIRSLFFLSQLVAKQFVKQGNGGKIINVASMLSYQGGIRVPSYTASKSAVLGLTRALANEWAKHGINVNAIAPGYMATNNTAALRRMLIVIRPFWNAFRRSAGANRRMLQDHASFSRLRQPHMSTASPLLSMAAGSPAN